MLLLLHGALGDRTTLYPLREALDASVGMATELLEFDGHGASAAAGGAIRLDRLVTQTLDVLAASGPRHLVGYSMGGYVALVAATRAPALVRSVFTLGTKLRWSPDVATDAVTQLHPDVMRAKVPAYAAQLAARHGDSHWAAVVRGTADALRALGDAPLLTEDTLGMIRCPVRITLGDRDRTVPLEELRWLLSCVSTASACVWPDTPHPLDRAPLPLIADAIRAFLSAYRDDGSSPAPHASLARD